MINCEKCEAIVTSSDDWICPNCGYIIYEEEELVAIKNWKELSKCVSDTHVLEINLGYGCGTIISKSDPDVRRYISTHAFYSTQNEYYSELLQQSGFGVRLISSDRNPDEIPVEKSDDTEKKCQIIEALKIIQESDLDLKDIFKELVKSAIVDLFEDDSLTLTVHDCSEPYSGEYSLCVDVVTDGKVIHRSSPFSYNSPANSSQ